MTCKDCIHYEACLRKERLIIDGINRAAQYASKFINDKIEVGCSKRENNCEFFADRSRFVELPCKVGNRLYVLFPKSKYIAEYVVTAFWVEEADVIIRIVDTRFYTTNILFTRDIGTKAFLTKKEAEQALKERENNG